MKKGSALKRTILVFLLGCAGSTLALAGISRPHQEKYRRIYENKALFLKVPIFGERQQVSISGRDVRHEQLPPGLAPRFKVGDQVRVLGIDFGGDEIKFKISGISGGGLLELVYKFDADLQESFPNSDVFDSALQSTFTEGLKYSDLDEAKKGYVEDQFERAVRELSSTTGTSREAVLKNMASRLPAFQEALRDVENLKTRTHELSGQLSQAQAEKGRLESELRQQQAELTKLRSVTASLQEKIDQSSGQLSKVEEQLRSARGVSQGYQTQVTNALRTLNPRLDSSKDLGAQIGELVQGMRKLQKDNETLESQGASLRSSLEQQRQASNKMASQLDDLKAANGQMRETITTLTSKEDSLARQYLQLKKSHENLQSLADAVQNLRTQVVEEKSEGGIRTSKIQVFLRNVLLGSFDWRVPERLTPNATASAELRFASESIDYVRVSPEERQLLRPLGEKLKLGVKLASSSEAIQVKPDRAEEVQEVGERDQANWRWTVLNQGGQDSRLVLQVQLVNKNTNEIPLLQQEQLVLSSSMVRQVRSYLEPIPLAVGAMVGFVFAAIVGIFMRSRKSRAEPRRNVRPADSTSYVGHKQL